jgi:hypothetical protein
MQYVRKMARPLPMAALALAAAAAPVPAVAQVAAWPPPEAAVPMPETVSEAVELLLASPDIGRFVRYEALEPVGRDGVVLHGITVTLSGILGGPLNIARAEIAEIDVESIFLAEEPDTFSIRLEGIDHATLGESKLLAAMLPNLAIPEIDPEATLSLAASLRHTPDEDPFRRDMVFDLDLAGHFAVRGTARYAWPAPGPRALPIAEAVEEFAQLELENRGFLGDLLRAQHAARGLAPEAAAAATLAQIRAALAPLVPGSPEAMLLDAAARALDDPDGKGIVRIHLATDDPAGLSALMEEAGGLPHDHIRFEIGYEPLG